MLLKDKWLLAIRQTTGSDNCTSLFLALLHRLWMSSSTFKVFHWIAIIRPVLVLPLWDNSVIACHCLGWLQDERLRSRCMSLWYIDVQELVICRNKWERNPDILGYFSSTSSPLLLLYPTGLCKPFSNPCLSLGPLLNVSSFFCLHCLNRPLCAPAPTFCLVCVICLSLYWSLSTYKELSFGHGWRSWAQEEEKGMGKNS